MPEKFGSLPSSLERHQIPIKCKMEYITLGTKEYGALSYTWGSPDELRTISLDGKTCYVRQNLWLALRGLRKGDTTQRLWIDALCINQADVDERNRQVRQTDRIYKGASKVVISSGPQDYHHGVALASLWEIYSKKGLPGDFRTCIENSAGNEKWYRKYLHMWRYISALCSRVYWTRLWIIQEVVLAANYDSASATGVWTGESFAMSSIRLLISSYMTSSIRKIETSTIKSRTAPLQKLLCIRHLQAQLRS